jgi:hypothetical protein
MGYSARTSEYAEQGINKMRNLTNSQKWIIVAFTATALTLAITFFLEGDVRTFAYVVVGLFIAGFAILSGNQKSKNSE